MAGPAKVIIQLQADASGVTPGIEALEELNRVDKSTADQFKAASKAFSDRGKVLDQSVTSTEKFVNASKKLVESVAGGAIKKATADISNLDKETGEVVKEMVVLAKTVQIAKQRLSELKPGTAGFNKIKSEIDAAEITFGNFNKTITSSRGALRQYRETLIQLEDAGLEGTKVFEEIAVAAGQLEDQVGDTQARIKALASDTFKFDAAIQAVQGIAGGFAVAQGAAALFGDESEEVQQALLKVNAAMAILQGLQQIQNVLQRQSSVGIAAQLALQRIAVLQTNLQAASESRFIIVRGAAIVAQRALNVVMAANPAGAVLFAIGALATAIVFFTRSSNDAVKAQEKFNTGLKSSIELTNTYVQSIQQAGDVIEANLRSQNASEKDIREARLNNIRAQLAEQEKAYNKANANFAKANEEYQKRIDRGKKISDEEREARIEAYDLANSAAEQYYSTKRNLELEEIENERKTNEESLKNVTSYSEAKVNATKKGSVEELRARIEAIRVRTKEELKTQTLLEGERAKIISESERNIGDLEEEIQRKVIQKRIDNAQAGAIRERDSFRKLHAETTVILLKAEQDTIGASAQQAKRIEAERDEAIRSLRIQLFGDLERLEIRSNFDLQQKNRAIVHRGLTASLDFQRQTLTRFQNERRVREIQDFDARNILGNLELEKADAIQQARIDSIGKTADEIVTIEQNLQLRLSEINKAGEYERENQRRQALEAAFQVSISLGNSLLEVSRNQNDAQLQILQDRLDKGLISEETFARESTIIKRRQAAQEKQMAIFQATINAAAAIVKVFQTTGPPLSFFLAATTAAATLAQIVAIQSKPLPAFKKGTKHAPQGPALVGEAGPELLYTKGRLEYAHKPMIIDLNRGDKVIPAFDTARIMANWNIPVPTYSSPGRREENTPMVIDYNRIGHAVGKQLKKLPINAISMNENGYSERQIKQYQYKNYVKNRYQKPR